MAAVRANIEYRENEQHRRRNLRRHIGGNFDNWIRAEVGSLRVNQVHPPSSSQLLFLERHAQSSLFLYHHKTGHEFEDAGHNYVELRYAIIVLIICCCALSITDAHVDLKSMLG